MALDKITRVAGRAVHVPGNDIDTDRIIPARFMKCVTFDGLGAYLFYDMRKNADGSEKPHPLNDPRFKGATVLLSGMNFGCGSSREHAPQALQKYGIRAVIAEGFAEIFYGNSTTLGMPCVTASRARRRPVGRGRDRPRQPEGFLRWKVRALLPQGQRAGRPRQRTLGPHRGAPGRCGSGCKDRQPLALHVGVGQPFRTFLPPPAAPPPYRLGGERSSA